MFWLSFARLAAADDPHQAARAESVRCLARERFSQAAAVARIESALHAVT